MITNNYSLASNSSSSTTSTPNLTSSSLQKTQQFMDAMRQSSIDKNHHHHSSSIRNLHKELLQRAVPISSTFESSSFSSPMTTSRNLYYNNNNNADNGDDEYSTYGFDMSSYSLKYASCSTISTFSDELAQDETSSTIFNTQQFVVFRLCPSDTCKKNHDYGCRNNYGEYMIPLYDWLETIAYYRENEFERYCSYCEVCGSSQSNNNNHNNNNDDDKIYYGRDNDNRGNHYYNMGDLDDKYARGDGRELSGDDDTYTNNYKNGYDCSKNSACSGYGDICYDEERVEWAQFFGCKKVNFNNQKLYIGPHCKSDKKTIVLSVFEDASCNINAGGNYDLGTLTDGLIQADSLSEYYKTDCISCKESVSYFEKEFIAPCLLFIILHVLQYIFMNFSNM